MHYPSINDEFEIEDYMAQLVDVNDQGLCKHIGVSNFTKSYIKKALGLLGDHKIFTNQVELHAYLHNQPIVEYCQSNGIRMTAYSPLARSALSNDSELIQVGNEVGGSASQVALAWLMEKGHIVIPSAGSPERIAPTVSGGRY